MAVNFSERGAEDWPDVPLGSRRHIRMEQTVQTRRELEALRAVAYPPIEERAQWWGAAEDSLLFLKTNLNADYWMIYASLGAAYIHSVLVATETLATADLSELTTANLELDTGHTIQHAYCADDYQIYLEGPVRGPGTRSIPGAEQLVFRRQFHGSKDHDAVIELSQRLVQALDLHWIPERSAYSRLDDRGDFEDVIIVHDKPAEDFELTQRAVLIMAKPLQEYMAVTGQALLRKFDFTRLARDRFSGWNSQVRAVKSAPSGLFYNIGVVAGHASYASGCQIVQTDLTVETMIAAWRQNENPANRKYETFKIVDRKNDRQIECSCGPDAIVSYFEASDKPWTISPVFFRPEVLARYKADPDKYDLTDRSLSCRNAWSLKTYDINEAGQVHTYIGYLANLPYDEQQYWRLHNELPKAGISKRAFENDILGEWSTDRDPLQSLRQVAYDLDRKKPAWWKPRGDELAARVLVPAGTASKEWGDELLALDQLIVEGFLAKELRALCKKVGVAIEGDWQGLKLIEVLLVGLGLAEDEAKKVVAPLRKLHHLRSKVKGHASPDERKALERGAIASHGSFRRHFLEVCEGCDDAMTRIVASLAVFDPPASSDADDGV